MFWAHLVIAGTQSAYAFRADQDRSADLGKHPHRRVVNKLLLITISLGREKEDGMYQYVGHNATNSSDVAVG